MCSEKKIILKISVYFNKATNYADYTTTIPIFLLIISTNIYKSIVIISTKELKLTF